MSELGPQARALLDAARSGASPTPADAARLWGRVSDSLANGAASGATATAGIGSKIAMALAIIATIGGGALLLAPARSTSTLTFAAPRVSEPPIAPPLTRAPPPTIEEQPALPLTTVPVEQLPRVPVPRIAPIRAVASVATVTAGASASASPASDDADVTMVRAAYVALRSGDAARALSLVDEHARRHPRSVLSEERDATRVLALCALGRRDSARTALQQFKLSFPSSTQLARTCLDGEATR